MHQSPPPVLLRDVVERPEEAVRLLERAAPYTPLGGWYRPDAELDVPSSALWFQNDWVHADLKIPGSELFLHNERYVEATRRFYDAEIVEPHSVYVNVMAAIERAGPAHTDNPRFQGRDRSNTPMWMLRAMFWTGLFDDYAIRQSTAIWWMNDVEGGGFVYWPEGPEAPPEEYVGRMANTALLGDNHGMFHQVGAIGPYDRGTILVTPRAQLAPASDGTGDWVVSDRGEEAFRAPLEGYRVSVLWKADVYRDAEEKRRQTAETLSIPDVVDVFNRDLEKRGAALRIDPDRVDDPGMLAEIAQVYPEPVPIERRPSIFDAA